MSSPSRPSQDVEAVGPAAGGELVAAVTGPTHVGLSKVVLVLPRGEELSKPYLAPSEAPVRPRMPLRIVPMNVDGTAEVVSGRGLLVKFRASAAQVMVTPTPAEGEPASVVLRKGAPLVGTVAYNGPRDVDNPSGTVP